jgi:N-methylhydantoinase B
MLTDRLNRASAPIRPLTDADVAGLADGEDLPMTPGVVQRGSVAFAVASGAPLAVAPKHWTDGCAVLETRLSEVGPEVTVRAYLDPRSGRSLYVEAVPAGEPRGFDVSPRRWRDAGISS